MQRTRITRLAAASAVVAGIALGPATIGSAQSDKRLVYADFEQVVEGRPVSARGGSVQLFGYSENPTRPPVFKGAPDLDPPAPELYEFRRRRGLPRYPRIIVYSLFGRLPLGNVVFRTPGVQAIVVTSEGGADELLRRGDTGLTKLIEPVPEPAALRRAHERLRREHGLRYLACEGGMTILRALRQAGLLDEVFLTTTDAVIDTARHEGVLKIFDFEREGARLVAEGRTAPDSGWLFQRWRFSQR